MSSIIPELINNDCRKKVEEMKKRGIKPHTFAWVKGTLEARREMEKKYGIPLPLSFTGKESFMEILRPILVLLYLRIKEFKKVNKR